MPEPIEVSASARPRSFVALMAILMAASATLFLGRCAGTRGVTPGAQRGAPRELVFARAEGGDWSLSGERGHVVAVNLWATWCGPCRAETPSLVRVNGELAGRGFRVVGVSLDSGTDRQRLVRGFATKYVVTYPMLFPQPLSQIESGLDGIPTTLLFDREGRAAMVYVGEIREASLRRDVLQLLAEP